jgi:hypothetical protein
MKGASSEMLKEHLCCIVQAGGGFLKAGRAELNESEWYPFRGRDGSPGTPALLNP